MRNSLVRASEPTDWHYASIVVDFYYRRFRTLRDSTGKMEPLVQRWC